MRINDQITASPVRLIDVDGEQLGILTINDAIQFADEKGMDLVEVSHDTDPTVCRIMDYGKYKYEISKRAKDARKKRHIIHVKEIKMRSEISGHDFDFKIRHAIEFLKRGDKVKFTLVFRGREILHRDHGESVLKRVTENLKDFAVVESEIRSEGRNLTMVMSSK